MPFSRSAVTDHRPRRPIIGSGHGILPECRVPGRCNGASVLPHGGSVLRFRPFKTLIRWPARIHGCTCLPGCICRTTGSVHLGSASESRPPLQDPLPCLPRSPGVKRNTWIRHRCSRQPQVPDPLSPAGPLPFISAGATWEDSCLQPTAGKVHVSPGKPGNPLKPPLEKHPRRTPDRGSESDGSPLREAACSDGSGGPISAFLNPEQPAYSPRLCAAPSENWNSPRGFPPLNL